MCNRVNDIDLGTWYEDCSVSSSHHSPTLNGKAGKADIVHFNLSIWGFAPGRESVGQERRLKQGLFGPNTKTE